MELMAASEMGLKEGQKIYYIGFNSGKHERFVRGDNLVTSNGTISLKNFRSSRLKMYIYAEEKNTITMDGEYAFARDPYTPVRVLCVDRNSKFNPPLIVMCREGLLYHNEKDGTNRRNSEYNLVPLKKKHGPVWVLFRKDGTLCISVSTEELAKKYAKDWEHTVKGPYTVVKMVEAED